MCLGPFTPDVFPLHPQAGDKPAPTQQGLWWRSSDLLKAPLRTRRRAIREPCALPGTLPPMHLPSLAAHPRARSKHQGTCSQLRGGEDARRDAHPDTRTGTRPTHAHAPQCADEAHAACLPPEAIALPPRSRRGLVNFPAEFPLAGHLPGACRKQGALGWLVLLLS